MLDPVLKAAQSIFSELGSSLSMSDVAEKAGISRPTLYRRFGTKSQLLAELARLEGISGETFNIGDRIIQSAYEVFSTHGFRAATIEQIAQGAGVGVATIYRKFGDKDGVVKAFIDSKSPKASLPTSIFESSDDFTTKIHELVRFFLEYVHENKALARMVYSGNLDDRTYLNSFRNQSNSSFLHLESFFTAYQASGRIPDKISAANLAAHLFGMVYAQTILAPWNETLDLEKAAKAITEMFLSYVKGCRT